MRALKTFLKNAVPSRILNTARHVRMLYWRSQQRIFDRRFGVNTSGTLYPNEMDVDEARRQAGNEYIATPHGIFFSMIRALPVDYPHFTFLDIGSGKGAALLYASRFPFRRIVGVEYCAALNQIAEENIRNYRDRRRKCRDIQTLCLDALEYPIPEDPLVLYLANPFKEELMSKMTANVERSARRHPRELVVMSLNPDVEDVLDRAEWLERVHSGWNHAIYRSKILAERPGEAMP